MSGLRFLDLFSGIGGFALGLERAGHHTAAFCEISPKCRHLLAHHWPDVPIYDDVQTLTPERLAADGVAVDAICGGFPCQDISDAGAKVGIGGARSGLWGEYARLIGELRPRYVVVENVAALAGRGLGVVLGDLATLGYDAEWDCIRASDVGAPHLRKRLWIVAYPRGEQHQGFGDAFRGALAQELLGALTELADADAGGCDLDEPGVPAVASGDWPHDGISGAHGALADAPRLLLDGSRRGRAGRRSEPTDGCLALADADRAGLQERQGSGPGGARPPEWPVFVGSRQWLSEPNVGRVAHGVPARVDRLHGLGNAVVPEIPYRLGRAISHALEAA